VSLASFLAKVEEFSPLCGLLVAPTAMYGSWLFPRTAALVESALFWISIVGAAGACLGLVMWIRYTDKLAHVTLKTPSLAPKSRSRAEGYLESMFLFERFSPADWNLYRLSKRWGWIGTFSFLVVIGWFAVAFWLAHMGY